MILYLDTSALVKLYVQEPGTDAVKAWVAEAEAAATSWVAYAETRAAFARARREGVTAPERHQERIGQFNRELGGVDARAPPCSYRQKRR